MTRPDRPSRERARPSVQGGEGPAARRPGPPVKATLRPFTTTLWTYESQHHGPTMHGSAKYEGATPSWVIWQCLTRYTREGDVVVDPMCGSGTTIDVARDMGRAGRGFDLAPSRPDIAPADARALPLPAASADFVFVDPPYSTHIDYSDDPACIGKLDASGPDDGRAYYEAMRRVIREIHRVLRDRRYMALYVCDSWRKRRGGEAGAGVFMPIGFELFAMMREHFKPIDIIAVVRGNAKLGQANWHKAALEGNYFMRGFNYLFIMKKESVETAGRRD
ncbi:MAG: DNA methyltransferase [Phycisphaerales bacterium]